ncbi:MAG: SAM-dependent methyltransferase [Kibdelosporangium sp.]
MTTRGPESPDGADKPVRLNMAKPSVTRIHDAMLGGKDNFSTDRGIRDRLLAADPEFSRVSFDTRDFTLRVTRFLAGEMGITQFLDLGASLPGHENTHDVAQRLNREATVLYVSRDPAVLALGRALLEDNDRTHMVEADVRKPRLLADHPVVAKYLDFDQPMAVYQIGTLHHIRDESDPAGILAGHAEMMAPGSYLAMAHLLDPGPDHELAPLADEIRRIYFDSGIGGWFRSREAIEAMMAPVQLLEPGLVTLADWWPDGPRLRPLGPTQRLALGALGRKV